MIVSTELIDWMGMTTGELDTFFGLCTANPPGMTEIVLRWNAMTDFLDGVANGTWVTKLQSVVPQANSYGLDVYLDLHTWWTTWDDYFDDAPDIGNQRATYLTFVADLISKVDSLNILGYMCLNEPNSWPASASENNFIIDCINAAKGETSKPVSVRFQGGNSPWDDPTPDYSSSVAAACDFYCINSYMDCRTNPPTTRWDCSYLDVRSAASSAQADGKELWITEFGLECFTHPATAAQEAAQLAYIEAWIDWAESEGNIDKLFCWVCEPETLAGEDFNLFYGYTPYDGFYALLSVGAGGTVGKYEEKGVMYVTCLVTRDPDLSGNYTCDGLQDNVEIQSAYDKAAL